MQHNQQNHTVCTKNSCTKNSNDVCTAAHGTLFATLSDTLLPLSCSPRKGNSDYAAQLFTQTIAPTASAQTPVALLRSCNIHHCTGCEACLHAPVHTPLQALEHSVPASALPTLFKRCPFSVQDESAQLFTALWNCSALLLTIPIHFYHVPALCKTFIDRLQIFWNLQQKGFLPLVNKTPRKAFIILLAGRPQGEKLFEGSLLSLKYALGTLNFTIDTPLLLRGVDAPSDLSQDSEKTDQIKEYARYAQKSIHTHT